MQTYDLIVIGAGSAGVAAAELAANMGASVALVDKKPESIGGCLYAECIPSKALVYAANQPDATWKRAQTHIGQVVARSQVQRDNARAYKRAGIDTFFGETRLHSGRHVLVGNDLLAYKKLLVATGSSPQIPAIPGLRAAGFKTSQTIFSRPRLPNKLAIIGSGPAGIELAFALRNLGVEVRIIEHNRRIFGAVDREAAAWVRRAMQAKDIHIDTSTSVVSVKKNGRGKELMIRRGGKNSSFRTGDILVAVGRQANAPRGLARQGVQFEHGKIMVDACWRTTDDHIYAVGDCTNFGREFAHVASSAAAQAVMHALCNDWSRKNLRYQPYVFFTEPEVAQAGSTAAQLERGGVWHSVHRLSLGAVDKAALDRQEGFAKVCTTPTGRLLGATVVGEHAGDIIGYFALALEKNWNLSELAAIPLPYPTLSFGVKQLAQRAHFEQFGQWQKWYRRVRKLSLR